MAVLVDEPFCLRPWEVLRLTRYQILHIYFRPKDPKTGKLIRAKATTEAEESTGWRDLIVEPLLDAGYSEEYAEAQWQEWLKVNPGATIAGTVGGKGAENGSRG